MQHSLSLRWNMEALQKDYWYLLVLLISLLLLKGSEQVKASGASVRLQDGMVLDCLCPWTGKLSMVSWIKKSDPQPLAIFHPVYGANFAKTYDGRVEFLKASPLDGSITIRNVTDSDVGLYSCSLQAFPQGSWTKDTLVEKQVISTTISIRSDSELVVLEDDDLILRCPHVLDAINEVTMEKLEDGAGGDVEGEVLAVCRIHHDGVELQEFVGRGRVNCSDDSVVNLHLHHVSQQDGGMYRCNYTTDTISHTITILLRILPKQGGSARQHRLYLLIGGGAFLTLVVLMSVVLSFRFLNRRKRRRREYRIQLHSTKRHPQNMYKQQGAMFERVAKQRTQSPIYANLRDVRLHGKSKR